MEIVISHIKDNDFEEVIDCLENSNVIVYDKSGVYKNDKYRIISKLQNLGDEGETYLTHIINNYDNLEDYTLFIQDGISACAEDLTNFKEVTTNMINLLIIFSMDHHVHINIKMRLNFYNILVQVI
jgi:hypothetical protein